MGFFKFLKNSDNKPDDNTANQKSETKENKKNETKSENEIKIEEFVVENFRSKQPMSAENAVIAYILLQGKKNNIQLALKDDRSYVYFNNTKINDFLRDWYQMLKLYNDKKISADTYQNFVKQHLIKNHAQEIQQTPTKQKQTNQTATTEQIQPSAITEEQTNSDDDDNDDDDKFDDIMSIFEYCQEGELVVIDESDESEQ